MRERAAFTNTNKLGAATKKKLETQAMKETTVQGRPLSVNETASRVSALINKIKAQEQEKKKAAMLGRPLAANHTELQSKARNYNTTTNAVSVSLQKGSAHVAANKLQIETTLTNETALQRHLPEALQPVTFDGCCESHIKSTCLTEKACNNSLYPFSSEEEAKMFEMWNPPLSEKVQHRHQCNIASNSMAPPTRWCSNNTSSYNFPTGCSQYSMSGRSGPYDRVLLFPQGKLAFCGIPKGGITQW